MDVVQQTWADLGISGVKALGRSVFVRTDKPEDRVGMIWLPPSAVDPYKGMPHQKLINATVLSAGPKTNGLVPGNRVTFQRLYFTRWKDMGDGTLVGWLDVHQLAGVPVE